MNVKLLTLFLCFDFFVTQNPASGTLIKWLNEIANRSRAGQSGFENQQLVCTLPSQSTQQTYYVHITCPANTVCPYIAGASVYTSTVITTYCSPGYQFFGGGYQFSSTCLQGKWTPLPPICYPTCRLIRYPNLDLTCYQQLGGNSIPCNDFIPAGAIVYPKCKDNYYPDRVVDYSYTQCQINGLWDRLFFNCIPGQSASIISYTNGNQQQNNLNCILPSSPTQQTYYITCPRNAVCSHTMGDNVPTSTVITSYCSEGYQFFGGGNKYQSTCSQGTWTPPFAICYPTCGLIGNPNLDLTCYQQLGGNSILCKNFMPAGAIVYPKCKENYHPDRQIDYSYTQCQVNGLWDRLFFNCIPDTEKPGRLILEPIATTEEPEGPTPKIGHSGDGSRGSKTEPPPQRMPRNDTGCIIPPQYTDQTHTVQCPEAVDCSHKAAGDQVPTFTQITVNCREGFQSRGGNTSLSSCSQRAWWPPIPKCYRTCALIRDSDMDLNCFQKLNGLSIPCDDFMPEGAIVFPKCKEHYHQDKMVDYTHIRCQSDGRWNKELFKCLAECGKAPAMISGLIANGTAEARGGSPWHVAIYDLSPPSGNQPDLICGGTIITPQIIVSAAHCFYDLTGGTRAFYRPSRFEIAVAKYTLAYNVTDYSDTKIYKIREILTPEITFTGYSTSFAGDIALLWTTEKIALSNGVLPACVEWERTSRFLLPEGTEGKLVGWGSNGAIVQSPVLLTAELPYIAYGNCTRINNEDFTISTDKFCAGSKKVGARPGDSGGGLLFRDPNTYGNLYFLRGVVSNKDATIGETETYIAAFTDVAQYVAWMSEKRNQIEKI